MNLVGLIPAAGQATRLNPLPCSKELLPVGVQQDGSRTRIKPVCLDLIQHFHVAGIETAYVVLRSGKWDIPAYLGSGEEWGIDLAYLTLAESSSPVISAARASTYLKDACVAFGFPDILLQPNDVFLRLLQSHREAATDVSLGLFPTVDPASVDVVVFDDNLDVTRVHVKPRDSEAGWTWMCAVWEPRFTGFLHRESVAVSSSVGDEVHIGHILQRAINAGLRVKAVPFENGVYHDVGTPGGLKAALRAFS